MTHRYELNFHIFMYGPSFVFLDNITDDPPFFRIILLMTPHDFLRPPWDLKNERSLKEQSKVKLVKQLYL